MIHLILFVILLTWNRNRNIHHSRIMKMIRGEPKIFWLDFIPILYQNSPPVIHCFVCLQRTQVTWIPMEYSKNSDMEYSKTPVKPSDMMTWIPSDSKNPIIVEVGGSYSLDSSAFSPHPARLGHEWSVPLMRSCWRNPNQRMSIRDGYLHLLGHENHTKSTKLQVNMFQSHRSHVAFFCFGETGRIRCLFWVRGVETRK